MSIHNGAFVPKNLEKRVKDNIILQAKELTDYDNFLAAFQKNLTSIIDEKSENVKEQSFIDLMKDCQIKTDQIKYSFIIFLFDKDAKFMFEYNWKTDIFWCSFDKCWSVFKYQFKMSHEDCQRFIADQVEIHFKFRPSTILVTLA